METRTIQTSTALNEYLDFPHLAQVFRIERIRARLDGKRLSREVAYGVTDLLPEQVGPKQLLDYARNHWHIENRLHWVRDVTFDEDRSQIRTRSAPRAFATLRNLVISLLRLRGFENIAEGLRTFAWTPKEQALAVFGF